MKNRPDLIVFITFITLILFCQCKRPDEIIGSKNGLTFHVQGINEITDTKEILANNNKTSKQGSTEPLIFKKEISTVGGVDYDYLLAESKSFDPKAPSLAVTKPLPLNTKYLIVLYETNAAGEATTYFDQAQATATSEIVIDAYRNKQYRWFAYSFNNGDDISPFNPANPNLTINPTTLEQGQEFLYATGLVQTSDDPEAENRIQITFQRKMSALRIELDARGIFSKIKSTSLEFPKTSNNTGLNNGVFSILNGTYSSISPVAFNALQWSDAIADSIPLGWVKYMEFLTVPSSGNISLSGNIKNTIINSQSVNSEAPNVDFFVDRTFDLVPFNIPAFTPEMGKRYILKIRLIESAINLVGANWARGNLTFFAQDTKNQYRFWYNNNFVNNKAGGMMNFIERDYFDTRPPRPMPQQAPRIWDPCKLVYPEGTWRLPTPTEFDKLISTTNNRVRYNQPGDKGWYAAWINNNVAGPPRYPNKNLSFIAAGYRAMNRTLKEFNYEAGNMVPLFPKYGDKGYYRTSDTSRYMAMYYRESVIFTTMAFDIIQSKDGRGANVRCVRK